MRAALLCLLFARGGLAGVYPLDNAVPWPSSGGGRILWSQGWDAFAVASSRCVRLNERGVYTVPGHWEARDLQAAGWVTAACVPVRGALCRTRAVRAFPLEQPSFDGNTSWAGVGCSRASDGRALDAGGGYDMSACDVLDGGGDAVLCGRTLAYRRTGVPTAVYWALCLLSVYAVRSLSYLVVRRLEPGAAPGQALARFLPDGDTLTVLACLTSALLCLAPLGDAVFATREEQLFAWVACAYVSVYLCVWAAVRSDPLAHADPPIYNLIAATLQLTAARLYTGVQTPYNPIIIWAIATRAMTKLRARWNPAAALTIFMDAGLLSLLCVLGFDGSPCYLVAVGTVALATSDLFD